MTVKAEHLDGDRWRVRVYAGHDLNGRQRQRTRTFRAKNQREANKLAARHESELRDDIANKRERGKTIAGLVDEWQALRDKEDSPSTVRKRAGMLARIRQDLGRIQLDDLSARHVDQWMASLRAERRAGAPARVSSTPNLPIADRRYSDTTIANYHSCLRAILRQGDRWDLVSSRPTMQARPPKRRSNRRPTPPTTGAVMVLIEAARPDLRIAAMLGAYAGMRAGEVMALRWSAVDLGAGVLHVDRSVVELKGGGHHVKAPKSGEARDVVISPALVTALAEHRADLEARARAHGVELVDDGSVLPDLRRDPTGRHERRLGWLSLAWQRHAIRQGAAGVRFHDLRHWYVTELADAGIPWPVIQRQVGHLQLSTTLDVYAHAVESGGSAAAAALESRLAKPLVDDSI